MWILHLLSNLINGNTNKHYFTNIVLPELITKVEEKTMDKYIEKVLKYQLYNDLFKHIHTDKMKDIHHELFISFRNAVHLVEQEKEEKSCISPFHYMDDPDVNYNMQMCSLVSDLSNTLIKQNCSNNCCICLKCYTLLQKDRDANFDTCCLCNQPIYRLHNILNEIQNTTLQIMENRNDMNDVERKILRMQSKVKKLKDQVDGI